MFNICKDIKFLEELKFRGFSSCYSLTIVEDKNFYISNKNEKEKDTQNYRTHGHLLTVDITVTAHWVKRVTGNRANSDSQWGWLYICLDF